MIRVCMCYQHRIEARELVDRNPGGSDSLQNSRKCGIEVWIGENPLATDLQQQRRMPDVGDPNAVRRTGIRVS